MTDLTHGTWVLVADSEKALFLRNALDAQNPDLTVVRLDEQENPSDRAQSANRPGRTGGSATGQRSALDDTDWHELAKTRFADDIADRLYKQAHRGAFDRIVLVAAPKVLGEIRDRLHKEVAQRVIAEIPKDLTNHPLDRIEVKLRDDLAA